MPPAYQIAFIEVLLTLEFPTIGTLGNLTIAALSGFRMPLPLLFIAGIFVLVTTFVVVLA